VKRVIRTRASVIPEKIDPPHVAAEHIDALVPRDLLYFEDRRPGFGSTRDEPRA